MKREVRRMKCPASLRPGEGGSGVTHHASNITPAFTLIELLVVIAIMGLLAAIAMPAFNKLKPNVMAAATQKLLTDVGRARQLAIAQHTTVYMVFVPPGFWRESGFSSNPSDLPAAKGLVDKQLVGYNFVSLRSIGDQPGRHTIRYLDSWRTLPEGTFIPPLMFVTNKPLPTLSFFTNSMSGPGFAFAVAPFTNWTSAIPFPRETANPPGGPWISLPFIAFNYLGQLVDGNGQLVSHNAFIPLAQGSVLVPRDTTKAPVIPPPTVPPVTYLEKPPGNTTNAFNVISIDWLTGRARVERQEVL